MADSPDFIYPSQTIANDDHEEDEQDVRENESDHVDADAEPDANVNANANANAGGSGDEQVESNEANGVTNRHAADGDDSDNESILSEVDEAQFEDFDPTAIAIDERPAIAVDETNVGLLGQHKRKRTEGEAAVEGKKKKKKRRERGRRRGDVDEDDFVGGEEIEGKRRRRAGDGAERRERAKARPRTPERDEDLTPEERRKRALDRAMDEALKNPSKRRRKLGGIDLDAMADAEIEEMRRRMTEAAQADNDARSRGQVAMHKVRLLPSVVALLNRNTLQSSLVDPDINLLEAVRFFLEPLSDGSLPAYNIQRELFAALARLPIQKDVLVASGIGKVTLFYTKSSRPEQGIKRKAEKLLGEWTRPILKRSDDYRKREYAEAVYDPTALPIRPSPASQQIDSIRNRALADTSLSNRARVDNSGPTSYTVVPRSNVIAGGPGGAMPGSNFGRAPGKGGGGEMWKRIKSRGQEASGGAVGGGGGGTGGSQRRR